MPNNRYLLITAARNEEAYIRKTLESVVSQTQWPVRWLIVSDGSTDRTDELVLEFALRYDFIQLLHLENGSTRSFSSKAFALNAGYDAIKHLAFDWLGFLDADISLPANYYEVLMTMFNTQPDLGLAGGTIVENRNGQWEVRASHSLTDVGGQMQLFRRKCYDDVGQFVPLQWGGEDTVANFLARRRGWQVHVFHDLRVCHHRQTGTEGATVCRARFRNGLCDYYLGYHPIFELAKCFRRLFEPPWGIGSLLRFCGYTWPVLLQQKPSMSADFVRYIRRRQIQKLLLRAGGDA
ncbi:MAG TPA: glycosyltransferase family A protein [Terriglobia bacterium]|jgi:glycosyltransferase involved in cell wall biosynthesis